MASQPAETANATRRTIGMLRLFCMWVATGLLMSGNAFGQNSDEGNARAALESAAAAMGGLERLRQLDNFQYTGFGQRYSSNGNLSPDPESPAKWQSVVDATRSFDLRGKRALNQERNSFQYPLAAPFGHAWALSNTLQQRRRSMPARSSAP